MGKNPSGRVGKGCTGVQGGRGEPGKTLNHKKRGLKKTTIGGKTRKGKNIREKDHCEGKGSKARLGVDLKNAKTKGLLGTKTPREVEIVPNIEKGRWGLRSARKGIRP